MKNYNLYFNLSMGFCLKLFYLQFCIFFYDLLISDFNHPKLIKILLIHFQNRSQYVENFKNDDKNPKC